MNYGEHTKARNQIFKIDKDTAQSVLASIANYFGTELMEVFATDIGDWTLEITNTEGTVYKYKGSLCADFEVDGVDLSDMVRDALGMDDLYVLLPLMLSVQINGIVMLHGEISIILQCQETNEMIVNGATTLILNRMVTNS